MSLMSSQSMNEDDDMDLSKWSSVIVKVGFPVVAASVLIWFLTFTVNSKLGSIEEQLKQQALESQQLNNSVGSLQNSVEDSTNEQTRTNLILQQICVNGSAVRDRPNCFR